MKKLLKGILAVIMVLPIFLACGVSGNAQAENTPIPDGSARLAIHKKKMLNLPDPKVQNTGAEMGAFDSYDPLPDIEFKVYDVTTEFYAAYTGANAQGNALAAAKGVDVTGKTAIENGTGTTDEDGDLYLDVPKKSGEKDAVYLIVETPKEGVTEEERMVVAFPVYQMTDTGTYTDTELTTIHLYPKNVVTVDGSLVVTKKGSGTGALLNGAKFIITREAAEQTQYLSGAENGIFTWSATETKAFSFESGKSYTISDSEKAVNGILGIDGNTGILSVVGFEYGAYTLIETEAPDNAGLIDEAYSFEINSEKKSSVFDVVNDDSLIEKTIPEITVGDRNFSIGEEIPYEISTNIPMGIGRVNEDGTNYYTQFDLNDTHDKALTYVRGALYVRDDDGDELIADVNYTFDQTFGTGEETSDKFKVAVNPEYIPELAAGKKLVYKYVMKLNDTATPDKGFENVADVETNHTSDTSDIVTVKTGGKRFVKVDQDAATNVLAGAKFIVARGTVKENNREYLVMNDAGEISWSPTDTDAEEYVSVVDTGIVLVTGLKYGQYFLIEKEAPTGYVRLTQELDFTVAAGTYADEEGILAEAYQVANKHKGVLPSTGGTGIVAFVLIGVVALGGAALYFTKGRRQIEG